MSGPHRATTRNSAGRLSTERRINAFDLPVGGLNEKGLHVGLFYFPGFVTYNHVKAADVGKALAPGRSAPTCWARVRT